MNRWRNYNPNPAGRSVGNCAVRALAKATGQDWETAYAELAKNAFQMADMPSSNGVIAATLRMHGFTREAIPNTCPDCYTIERFAEEHPAGTYVVGTGNHVVTIQDGQIWDAWDSSQETPLFFWRRNN